MTLKARLTLGSALMATLTAGAISAVDLARITRLKLDATLEQAQLMEKVAVELVGEALNRQRSAALPEALRDPELSRALVNGVLAASRAIVEVAVVSPGNQIMADSDPARVGSTPPKYGDFNERVGKVGWYGMAELLASGNGQYYQLEQALGPQPGQTLVYVRVIVAPALIFGDIQESLAGAAIASLLAIAGAAAIAFLASAVTFRKLGQIGRMLDLAARGELEPEQSAGGAAGGDELSVMASKVSLLGQRLRGAQFEVSDLRGNIDRLLQDLEDAVFIFNREGRLIFASGAVERFLGGKRADLAGQTIAEVFPPSTSLGQPVGETARTGHPVRNRRVELAPAGEGGTAAAAVLLSVDVLERLPGTAGSGVLVRLRDPEAQRNIGRQLQMADRLAAMSRVTGGVAHEVKNPLNAILLHMEVVRAKMARGDADIAQPMEIISREILRLDRVVKTFLDFTKPVDLKFANVDLCVLMDEVAELARPLAAASNIQVEVRLGEDGVEARADPDLLKQAVLNVVMNAIEAMPGGGALRLEALANRETAELRISDTGGGIPPELREKIFRLYFTTKPKGSGIGLAMTFRIVQLQDGTIDFASEPGKGTTFSIRLPIAA